MKSQRVWMAGCTAAVALSVGGCGGSSSVNARRGVNAIGPAFGQLAGYVWRGQVRSVGASWVVPSIGSHSRAGRAATWIGAQAPIRTGTDPFIQVGTNEEREPDANALFDRYYAFWSDTVRHFHPVPLFNVRPQDDIRAQLKLRGRGWDITIQDVTSGATARFSTSQDVDSRFGLGEWLQEDITNAHTTQAFPYPTLAPTRFTRLTVNAAPPRHSALDSQWMSTSQGDLGPSPFNADSFVVHHVAPTRIDRQYLDIAVVEDSATNKFIGDFTRWTRSTQRDRIVDASSAFAQALTSNMRTLVHSRWPPRVATLVGSLIRATSTLRAVTLTARHTPSEDIGTWTKRWTQAARQLGKIAAQVRQALHIPDLPQK